MSSTSNTCSRTAPSSRRTRRRPAQRGACHLGIGDKASVAKWQIEEVEKSGAVAVIPRGGAVPNSGIMTGRCIGWRHQIENVFARIEEIRAIATRKGKTDASFAAAIHLEAGVVLAT